MSEHSLLAPSSYGRLAYCRAAPTMEAAYPDEDTPHAIDGRASHAVNQQFIVTGEMPALRSALEGTEVTQEMIDGALLYVGDIANELGAAWFNHIHIEERVDLSGLHPKAWGTPDAFAIYPGFIYLWDYKFGHRYVDPFENWQLIGYAYDFVSKLSPEEELSTTIQMTIVQPRNFHKDGPIRRWTVKAWELRPYFNQLKAWLEEAMREEVTANPAWQACQDCSARHACVPLRNACYAAMDYAMTSQAHNLQPDQLGVELARVEDVSKLLEAYKSGLEEEAVGVLKRGASIPNYTMAPGQSSLAWTMPPDFIISQLGEQLRAPLKVITPTQAKTQKLVSEELLEAFADRPPAGLKLARIDTKLAKKVFKP